MSDTNTPPADKANTPPADKGLSHLEVKLIGEVNRLQDLLWKSMHGYSHKLGWGLSGAQPECWTCLDGCVDELVKRRKMEIELHNVAAEWWRKAAKGHLDPSEVKILQDCAAQVLKIIGFSS